MKKTIKKTFVEDEYKDFKKMMENEYPRPFFIYDDNDEIYFQRLKEDYPDMSIHKDTGMGEAVCLDKKARMILSYELIGAQKAYAYMQLHLSYDAFDAQMEGIKLQKYIKDDNTEGGF